MLSEAEKAKHRSIAFEDDPSCEVVEHRGREGSLGRFEVRALSMLDEQEARKASMKTVMEKGRPLKVDGQVVKELDAYEFGIRRVILATYIAGTNERLFDIKDLSTLLGTRVGKNALLTKLTFALKRVSEVDEEAEEGKSASPVETSTSA